MYSQNEQNEPKQKRIHLGGQIASFGQRSPHWKLTHHCGAHVRLVWSVCCSVHSTADKGAHQFWTKIWQVHLWRVRGWAFWTIIPFWEQPWRFKQARLICAQACERYEHHFCTHMKSTIGELHFCTTMQHSERTKNTRTCISKTNRMNRNKNEFTWVG